MVAPYPMRHRSAKVGFVEIPLTREEATEMKITTIGIDLAKNVFQVHGVDERGKTGLKRQLKRAQMLPFFANRERCLIGMEACAGAHFWARKLQGLGHSVKLMAPQYVKPYVKSNKNDAADAEAICEAVGRPNMRFVAVKNGEQQAILAVHRARQGLVKARTAQANQIRGLLGPPKCKRDVDPASQVAEVRAGPQSGQQRGDAHLKLFGGNVQIGAKVSADTVQDRRVVDPRLIKTIVVATTLTKRAHVRTWHAPTTFIKILHRLTRSSGS
jgi:hypothetical protein